MHMFRRPAPISLALVTALSLALVACGDDDDGGEAADTTTAATSGTTAAPDTTASAETTAAPDTTAAPETTAVELTGDPVKIMVLYEGSGAVATPEVPEGAIAAAEALNAAGGIDGSPVEILQCDLANDPNQARACGEQAVSEGVVAAVGPVSANAGEYFPVLEAAQIPVVGNVPAAAADFTSAASYPLYGGIVSASAGLADVLVSQGGATTISLARIELAAAAAIGIFANQSLARGGMAVNKDVSIPVGAPDMAPYVASVLEGGTNGVLVGLTGQDATNFIVQLRQTNPDIPISATTTEFAAVVEALGDLSDGIYVTGFFHNETTNPEAWETYVAAMEAAGFDELSGFRTNSYSAVQVVAEVLAGLPERTAAALYGALPTVQGVEVDLLPPVQFTEPKVELTPRVFNVCGLYQQLEGGEFTTLSDGFIDMFTGEPC
jgi:ABC-type branched-subunit amino acid transport system substrate-binding protein